MPFVTNEVSREVQEVPSKQTLISCVHFNSQVQDKLKIAFAEGYTANSGDDKKNKKFLGISFGWVCIGFA